MPVATEIAERSQETLYIELLIKLFLRGIGEILKKWKIENFIEKMEEMDDTIRYLRSRQLQWCKEIIKKMKKKLIYEQVPESILKTYSPIDARWAIGGYSFN